jgi:mRNA-degrading endonuclease RelE of RelBE toxin-antitoxin system
VERIATASQEKGYRKLSKSIRDQIQIVLDSLNTRAISHRAKVEKLRAELDE